ncbi:ZW10 interactor-like isoform X1 [Rhineura floridana]|uniref:ZW10 interactor-like isoform X1 n=1 Tax=Rhineura floridana TaxID=261503 RepID=UPI002AC7E6CC|nr:ZW10 interactor-like isoform X1 [Rhineura floridana]
MAVEVAALELLAQLKDELTFESQTKHEVEAQLPAQILAEHAVSTRKTHKLMYSQLQVVRFLLDFLDSAPCIQDASESAVRQEVAEAKQQWKTLKAEYQQQVERIKEAVPQMLLKLEKARNRAQLLEEALHRYQDKKREMEEKMRNVQKRHQKEQEALCEQQQQLEERVAELQDRLQMHRLELQCLQGELEEQERQACDWREKVQRISDFQCLLETLQGVKLISASESDLEVELTSHSQVVASTPHHLKLHLYWRDNGSVMLQSDSPFFLLSAVLPLGTCSTIKGIILELQHSYSQQAQLLAEIESLQSCFAIDWQQEKRMLSYLKPTSTWSLYLEPGYPASGGICLCSVKSQHGTVDVTSYKPPQERPSLQNWLEYLSTVDFSTPFLA